MTKPPAVFSSVTIGHGLLLATLVAVRVPPARAAGAADKAGVLLEPNKLEPNGKACRAYIVRTNATKTDFGSLKLDLVMFDADGVVARRVAMQGAPLVSGKTSLKVFDIDGVACDRIGRVLLNDVMDCGDSSGSREDCIGQIRTSSRTAAPLIK